MISPVAVRLRVQLHEPDPNIIKYGEMTSAAFFSTIPVLILVLFVQKQIVRGLTFGAVKG